jgi:hypothetical protein
MKTKCLNELLYRSIYLQVWHLILAVVDHATPIVTFPLMLTQGAKKLTNEAQPARATAMRKTAFSPSM